MIGINHRAILYYQTKLNGDSSMISEAELRVTLAAMINALSKLEENERAEIEVAVERAVGSKQGKENDQNSSSGDS